MKSLSQSLKVLYAKSLAFAFVILLISICSFIYIYHTKEKGRYEGSLRSLIDRQASSLSSQLIIYKLYKIPFDPNLLEMARDVHPRIQTAVQSADGKCVIGNCYLFDLRPQVGSIYLERKLDTLEEQSGKVVIYLPMVGDFIGTLLTSVAVLVLGLLSLLVVSLYLNRAFIERELNRPFQQLLTMFHSLEMGNYSEIFRQNYQEIQIAEVHAILENFVGLVRKIIAEIEEKSEAQRAISALAQQVNHDIRSPLAALQMVTTYLDEVPEDTRILIRSAVHRIDDITNVLIARDIKTRSASFNNRGLSPINPITGCRIVLLSSLIEGIVTEKRMQYRAKMHVRIEASLSSESYGLFSEVDETELERAISNLLNNSVEAIGGQGCVHVGLETSDEFNVIVVSDNGPGIPSEIIHTLGTRGTTYGKKTGNGLGLYHARSTVEASGGRMSISSSVGGGTQVRLFIKKADPPSWFLPRLELSKYQEAIILDDDTSIHQIWERRFLEVRKKGCPIRLNHFSTADAFREWFVQHPGEPEKEDLLYLIDYELLGEGTGLELIQELGIRNSSILVTSRFEDLGIRACCQELGVKLIPKGLASIVPILDRSS